MTTNEKVLIKVENLQKSFEDNKVLDGISTEIRQGEVVAVIGPSGSGKSTFLRSLNRLEIPTGGKIYFEGVDITAPETDIDHVRQKIGMVFQQFNLFPHKTVKENILLAPQPAEKFISRALTSRRRKPISTMYDRGLEWYFSSSTCFRIKPSRKISCSPR